MRTVIISTTAAFNAPLLAYAPETAQVYSQPGVQATYAYAEPIDAAQYAQYAPQAIVQMEAPVENVQDSSLGWWCLGAGAIVVGAAAMQRKQTAVAEPDLEAATHARSIAAFALSGSFAPKVQKRAPAPKMAAIADTLSTIQGPDLYWEEKGPLQNPPKEESDFKEYDTFSIFLDACAKHGVDLNQSGITVFAPSNKACEEFMAISGELTKDVCAYHIVKGEVSTDSLASADLTTVQGGKITYRRMFRKDFVDNAFCAVKASPPRTSYQGNIKADNGIIHMINEVIYPGWTESSGGYGSEDNTRA
jgi:uncharacterized surface protein with fasciclin (FAS1) repeats